MSINYRESHNSQLYQNFLGVEIDMHAHIIPFLDNGPDTHDEAIEMCILLVKLGFNQCIATPHIMKEYYDNSEEKIIESTIALSQKLEELKIGLRLRPAGEYFLDEGFLDKLKRNKPLLTLDDKNDHVLIEIGFLNEYEFLVHCIKRMMTFGYKPVLAHPEKYNFLFETDKKIEILKRMGLKCQINMSSFLNSNIKSTKENLHYLMNHNLIDFIGTNVHSLDAAAELFTLKENPNFQKTLSIGIHNNDLRF